MIEYQLLISNQFVEDRDRIYRYISFFLLAPTSAIKLIDEIYEKIEGLKVFPNRNPMYIEQHLSNRFIRKTAVDDYCVVYAVDDEKRLVECLRIVHQTQEKDYSLHDVVDDE